jgi:hypothetical protein
MGVIHVGSTAAKERQQQDPRTVDRTGVSKGKDSPSRFSGASCKGRVLAKWNGRRQKESVASWSRIRRIYDWVQGRGRRKRMQPWKPRGSGRDDMTTPMWGFHCGGPMRWFQIGKVPLGRGCLHRVSMSTWQMKPSRQVLEPAGKATPEGMPKFW